LCNQQRECGLEDAKRFSKIYFVVLGHRSRRADPAPETYNLTVTMANQTHCVTVASVGDWLSVVESRSG